MMALEIAPAGLRLYGPPTQVQIFLPYLCEVIS